MGLRGQLRRGQGTRIVTVLLLAAATAIAGGLLAVGASGKKKHGGSGVTVLSTQQQAILNAHAISVPARGAKGKRVVVGGINGSGGAVALTDKVKAHSGKLT